MSRIQEPYVDNFEAQISLAESIWISDITGNGRIAFVLLDNVIEFMSKAYLKVTLGLVDRSQNPRITPNQWHQITRRFDKLMTAMGQHSPLLSATIDSIKKNHGIRNELYHTSTPTEVRKPLFSNILKDAIEVIESLYGVKYKSKIIDVAVVLHGKPDLEDITQIVGEDKIRFDNTQGWNLSQCTRVVIHGYASKLGKNPNFQEIIHSLRISQITPTKEQLQQCIRNLRSVKQVEKATSGTFSLSPKGKTTMMDGR